MCGAGSAPEEGADRGGPAIVCDVQLSLPALGRLEEETQEALGKGLAGLAGQVARTLRDSRGGDLGEQRLGAIPGALHTVGA